MPTVSPRKWGRCNSARLWRLLVRSEIGQKLFTNTATDKLFLDGFSRVTLKNSAARLPSLMARMNVLEDENRRLNVELH